MKKIVTLISFLIVTTAIFAQKSKVTSAIGYKESGDLEKAYESIQTAVDPNNDKAEKSIPWPKTWQVKGQILQEIHRKGKVDIVKEPLFEAYDAYMKAIELDEDDKFSKSLVIDLTFLQTDFSNYGLKAHDNEDFDLAMRCFEKYIEITNIPIMNPSGVEIIDTAMIFNAGLVAYKAKNWESAIKFFTKSVKYDYNGPTSSYYGYMSYKELKDTVTAISFLKECFEKYPDTEALLTEMINYYLEQDSTGASKAIDYLDLAIKNKPDNVSFYLAKASALSKLGREEESMDVFRKSIEVDPTQFLPYYRIGMVYYNNAVDIINAAVQLPASAQKEYEEEMEKGNGFLKQALPYIEKAYEIDSSELGIIESLRLIYYRLQANDPAIAEKFRIIDAKLKELKQK